LTLKLHLHHPFAFCSFVVSTGPAETSPRHTQPQSHDNIDIVAPTNTYPMVTRAKSNIYKPKTFHATSSNESAEPSTYKQAMQSAEWLSAMQIEYDAL